MWIPLCIVRSFQVFLPNCFGWSTIHYNILASYLNMARAYLFITFVLSFPINLGFEINLILLIYYLTNSVSFSFALSYSNMPRYFYHFSSIVFIKFPSGRLEHLFVALSTFPCLSLWLRWDTCVPAFQQTCSKLLIKIHNLV